MRYRIINKQKTKKKTKGIFDEETDKQLQSLFGP